MSSAVDNGLTSTPDKAAPSAGQKRNAVAHEVPVSVTGARPGDSSGKRGLFTEATASVLVFENGGVIRLAADVVAGQLLFLTHGQTKREVVGQVTRQHDFQPGSHYIELEFTEPAPGFWGITFPENTESLGGHAEAKAALTPAAALMQAVEAGPAKPAETAATPSAEEVDRLKQEVEALRQQLQSLQHSASTLGSTDAAAQEPAEAPSRAEMPRMRLPSMAAPPKRASSVAQPAGTGEGPEASNGEPDFSAQDLLPPVSLDFSKAAKAIERTSQKVARKPAGRIGGAPRLAVLTGLLVVAGGLAWYKFWLARPVVANVAVTGSAAPKARVATPVAAEAPKAGGPSAGLNAAATLKTAGAQAQPASTAIDASAANPKTAEAKPDAIDTVQPRMPEDTVAERPTVRERAASEKTIAPRGIGTEGRSPELGGSSATGEMDAMVPAKLIQSVKAVAPPEAVRQFVTGNVVLDGVVDVSGRVKSMTVISGPAPLRKAAEDAVRQYLYEPARQNGKAVTSHVRVIVQFWYEP